jgi:hypothetical protein
VKCRFPISANARTGSRYAAHGRVSDAGGLEMSWRTLG